MLSAFVFALSRRYFPMIRGKYETDKGGTWPSSLVCAKPKLKLAKQG
jgi:hypothetical protein